MYLKNKPNLKYYNFLGMSVKKGDNGKIRLNDSEKHLPSVPCYKLTAVAAPLMNHLKALMQVIQDQETEINFLRQQNKQLKVGLKIQNKKNQKNRKSC